MRGLLQTGAVGFVVKPYKFKALLQQIRAVLEDRRR
jgi:DNA-binding response OmpR family regulator